MDSVVEIIIAEISDFITVESLSWSIGITLIGIIIGYWREKQFIKQLEAREAVLEDITITNHQMKNQEIDADTQGLIDCSIVLSRDLFRTFFIFLRRLFGGNVAGYEQLVDLARREAIVRMKEEAVLRGANWVINLKLTTHSLNDKSPRVEVLAYGTALFRK